MSEKSALFMARTTRFHEFARSLTTTLGVEVSLATPDSPTAAHAGGAGAHRGLGMNQAAGACQ